MPFHRDPAARRRLRPFRARALPRALPCLLLVWLGCATPPDEAPDAPGEAPSANPCSAGCSRAHPGCAGWVQLEYDVSPEGAVEDARVLASCPAGRHDETALGVVSNWRYEPSESGQQDVRIQIDFGRAASDAEPGDDGEAR